MSIEIAGRTAFITGGANGIGLGIARAFAKAGAKVAVTDVDATALERAKQELSGYTEVAAAVLDVRDRDSFEQTAQGVEALLGPVSLLFNNAGVAGGAPVEKLTYDLWDWGMGINLDGVINGVQTFLPRMVERGLGGHIVHTSSGAGLAAEQGGVLYHTAKFAVVGMAEALAIELEKFNIGVSVLCPGPVATDIVRRTRKWQPSVKASLSEEQLAAARAISHRQAAWLQDGASPDWVGEEVLYAVRHKEFYIYTDRYMEPFIQARTKALLDALPSEERLRNRKGDAA